MGQHDTMMAVLDMYVTTGLLTGQGPEILQSMVGTRYIRTYYEGRIYKYTKNKYTSIYTSCIAWQVECSLVERVIPLTLCILSLNQTVICREREREEESASSFVAGSS